MWLGKGSGWSAGLRTGWPSGGGRAGGRAGGERLGWGVRVQEVVRELRMQLPCCLLSPLDNLCRGGLALAVKLNTQHLPNAHISQPQTLNL